MKDELTRDEQNLFQLMADGVIVNIMRDDVLPESWDRRPVVRWKCSVRVAADNRPKEFASHISALDAYLQAVAYITAAALEGKQVYSARALKKRATLNL